MSLFAKRSIRLNIISEIPTVQTRYPNLLTWPLSARKKRETRGMFREVLEAESHSCLYRNPSLDLDQSRSLPVSALVRTYAALLPESPLLQDLFPTCLSPSASWSLIPTHFPTLRTITPTHRWEIGKVSLRILYILRITKTE